MTTKITFEFTDEALAVIGEQHDAAHTYEGDHPVPQPGDFVELETDSLQTFVVIGRKFSFLKDGTAVHLFLDLPASDESDDDDQGEWDKLDD